MAILYTPRLLSTNCYHPTGRGRVVLKLKNCRSSSTRGITVCGSSPCCSSSRDYDGPRRRLESGAVRSRTPSFHVRVIDAQVTCSSEVVGEPNIPCKSCKGKGWLVCDFCEGQKVNVQSRNNRIYRRCPSCRAAGVVICPLCKVFKCVTFPDDKDGGVSL